MEDLFNTPILKLALSNNVDDFDNSEEHETSIKMRCIDIKTEADDKENIAPTEQSLRKEKENSKKGSKGRRVFGDITHEVYQAEYRREICEDITEFIQGYSQQIFGSRARGSA